MSNLDEIKEKLAKNQQLESIINPQPNKKIKLPLQRDIQLVERILEEKLSAKRADMKTAKLEAQKLHWADRIEELHTKAANLKQEFKYLDSLIQANSNKTVQMNDVYSGYWNKLPDTALAAEKEDEFLELVDDTLPEVEKLDKEIDAHLLDIKLGLSPLSDVKLLLAQIEQLK